MGGSDSQCHVLSRWMRPVSAGWEEAIPCEREGLSHTGMGASTHPATPTWSPCASTHPPGLDPATPAWSPRTSTHPGRDPAAPPQYPGASTHPPCPGPAAPLRPDPAAPPRSPGDSTHPPHSAWIQLQHPAALGTGIRAGTEPSTQTSRGPQGWGIRVSQAQHVVASGMGDQGRNQAQLPRGSQGWGIRAGQAQHLATLGMGIRAGTEPNTWLPRG